MNESRKFRLVGINGAHNEERDAIGEEDADGSGQNSGEQTFDYQHPHQPYAADSEGETHGDLSAAHNRPGQKQDAHIHASKQEDE